MMRYLVFLSLCCIFMSGVFADEIGFIERFSLADDRADALRELTPGTDEYFHYHALHAQNTGERRRFGGLLEEWRAARHGILPANGRELEYRQALLDYERDPQGTVGKLRRWIPANLAHTRAGDAPAKSWPAELPEGVISDAAMLSQLRTSQLLHDLSVDGLGWLAEAKPDAKERAHLLATAQRPDLPGLVELVAEDMRHFNKEITFGKRGVHQYLTLSQLESLSRQMPELLKDHCFVETYLSRLVPEDEADAVNDLAVREACLERLRGFAATLDPVFNSLKAHILYNGLRLDRALGRLDRQLLLEYLRIPRNVPYLPRSWRERVRDTGGYAQLEQSYDLPGCLPIPPAEPAVRRCLLDILKDAADTREFEQWLDADYLRAALAEAKIVNGRGKLEQWASLLAPEEFQRLRERVDIDLSEDNPNTVGVDDKVVIKAFVKNVSSLLVKVYEINTFNYYTTTGKPLNLALNLDGLAPTYETRHDFREPAERRVERSFELERIKGRGVYVVELIGNGHSSRALVRKGELKVVQEITAAGHAFTVWDEEGRQLPDASAWLDGRCFPAAPDGFILVPFAAKTKPEKLVISHGSFATLVEFRHLEESYTLDAGLYVDREALIGRGNFLVALRPVLRVNDCPAPLKLLEERVLRIKSTDIHGIESTRDIPLPELSESAECVQEVRVPEGVARLEMALHAKVRNVGLDHKQEVSSESVFTLNGMEKGDHIRAFHMGADDKGFFAVIRGKNGELGIDTPVRVELRHRYFKTHGIKTLLQSDARGRIYLGGLPGILSVTLESDSLETVEFRPPRDRCAYPASLHGVAGAELRLAIPVPAPAASLLEVRRGRFVRDCSSALRARGGLLSISGLEPGDYSLRMSDSPEEIRVRITAGGRRDGYIHSARRTLELPALEPLAIDGVSVDTTGISIKLANASAFTRVHLIATRYLPAYDLFERMDHAARKPLLSQVWRSVATIYESGRDIGDEYRYILDRQRARIYPGNMLERPGLLLNPWALRATDAKPERLAAGADYVGQEVATSKIAPAKRSSPARAPRMPSGLEGYASLDFLPDGAVTLFNLQPDSSGCVNVSREELAGRNCLRIMVVDPVTTIIAHSFLPETPFQPRDLRQLGAERNTRSIEVKAIAPLQAGETIAITDAATARTELYDTVAKLYQLYTTLNGDTNLTEFAFIVKWPQFNMAEKCRLYSQHACHELNIFLYRKDPGFFEDVIAPALGNKRHKTFLDNWLLGADLRGYLEPHRFARLNAAERALLGKRLRGKAAGLARDIRERSALDPLSPEEWVRRFNTALRSSALEEREDISVADFRASPAPAMEARALGELNIPIASKSRLKSSSAVAQSLAAKPESALDRSMERVADGRLKPEEKKEFIEASLLRARQEQRPFFRRPAETREWAENDYWNLAVGEQGSDLVRDNGFWAAYAAHDGKSAFLAKSFLEPTSNFSEMMLALALLDLPFEAAVHQERTEGAGATLQAGSPLLLCLREVREDREEPVETSGILVAESFFRKDDNVMFVGEELVEKDVTDEFLKQVVYGARIVLTNPGGESRRVGVLLRTPPGALPVCGGSSARGVNLRLEPYSVGRLEHFFYFPAGGRFQRGPLTVSQDGEAVGGAPSFLFNVLDAPSRVDKTSWAWISRDGDEQEVLRYLKNNNLHRVNLAKIAWRMRDAAFFKRTTALLSSRHLFHEELWAYSLLHCDATRLREYLSRSGFAAQCGMWLDSPLLKIEPVERLAYQYLEYAPLINPRAHQVGARRMIRNQAFLQQYRSFMKLLSYKRTPDMEDMLAIACYMLLQDRVDEALAWFGRVERERIAETMQYDYLGAYLALYGRDLAGARELAAPYTDSPLELWGSRFRRLLALLDRVEGRETTLSGAPEALPEHLRRDLTMEGLAESEATLEMKVEARMIRLESVNLAEVTLNFYPMDIELLFSRTPFMQEGTAQFALVRPLLSRKVSFRPGSGTLEEEMPEQFKGRNLIVEAVAGGLRRTQTCYASDLKLHVAEQYGQLAVSRQGDGAPVAGAYVKVYARMRNGGIEFVKDGYTDLRGCFDYVSLNSDMLEDARRLAILVLSKEHGSVVREAGLP